ncbi:Putative universal stress protein [Polaromonas vacuolata]|uniref:Universal stress protein n=1 Tax=Polaromonas vacuolata TaxID=37448 RepID=A0A6H2HAQ5_9BURK|nr:universal stress protein [Polaromonas vacuolata]QJC56962.1 Putative universal stress protein [Polaromonas vacuolata]
MFSHILLPVDGSSASNKSISKALAMAQAFKSEVTLVSVIDAFAFTGMGTEFAYGQAEYLGAATAQAKQDIQAAKKILTDGGVAVVNTKVIEGSAAYDSILETAESCGADLIVMGSHGRKGLEKLVLGSVASQVLSHTHLPVLIVRA